MNRNDVGRIIFDERHTVSAEPRAPGKFRHVSQANGPVDTMTSGQLVTLLESLCLRELERYLDPAAERAVGHAIQLRYSAAIPRGALLRIRGWVDSIGERNVTFCVDAEDEHEQVCEGTVCLAVAGHGELSRRIERKIEAIARRELFLAA